MNISQDERERAIYRSRRKFQTDLQSDFATAEDRGERRGERKGEHKGRVDVARNLLKLNLPLEQIITATELTREEVERLRKAI